MGSGSRSRVYSTDNGMPGKTRFDCRITFHVSHLAHAHHIRIKTERGHHEVFLCDVVCGVIRRSGECVNDVVDDRAVFIPSDKAQLSRSRFNREHTLVVGDRRHDRVQQSRFTRACGSGDNERDTVPDTHTEEVHHLLCRKSRFNEVFSRDARRVQESDGNRHTAILVYDGVLERGDTGVSWKMSLRCRRSVVDDHSAVMEQTLDDIHRVLRAVEVILEFDDRAVKIRQGDIVPAVHVDFLEIGRSEERGQHAVFCHLAVELVDEFLRGEVFNVIIVISEILVDIRLELIQLVLIGEHGSVML